MIRSMTFRLFDVSIYINGRILFDRVNVAIQKGFLHRIEGKNGIGKTVLMNTLLGLHTETTGSVQSVYDKKAIAYIPDILFFLDDEKVSDVIAVLKVFYKIRLETIHNILKQLNLCMDDIKALRVHELSLGMKWKLNIIPLFLDAIDTFFLDEILIGLDKQTQALVCQKIRRHIKAGKTIVMIDHNDTFMMHLMHNIPNRRIICHKKNLTFG